MTIEPRWRFALALAGTGFLPIGKAAAQLRWDAGIQAGVTQRVTSGRAAIPTPGPSVELHVHVAVLPMIRVGPYAAFDVSPAPMTNARMVYASGLRAKWTPPLFSAPWHAWTFIGIGFADAYTPRHLSASDVGMSASSVGMLELPVGVGAAYRFHGPWELYAELGSRIVLVRGSIGASSTGTGVPFTPLVSDDLLAVSLSAGVSLTR